MTGITKIELPTVINFSYIGEVSSREELLSKKRSIGDIYTLLEDNNRTTWVCINYDTEVTDENKMPGFISADSFDVSVLRFHIKNFVDQCSDDIVIDIWNTIQDIMIKNNVEEDIGYIYSKKSTDDEDE